MAYITYTTDNEFTLEELLIISRMLTDRINECTTNIARMGDKDDFWASRRDIARSAKDKLSILTATAVKHDGIEA